MADELNAPGQVPEAPDRELVGWCAIAVPDQDFFQGFFIKPEDQEAGEAIIRNAQSLTGTYMPPSATISPVPGVAADKQVLIGMLLSLIVEFAVSRRFEQVGVVGSALMQVTGKKFWWVEASVTKAGTNSKFHEFGLTMKDVGLGMRLPLPVSNTDEARRALLAEPVIEAISARVKAKVEKQVKDGSQAVH